MTLCLSVVSPFILCRTIIFHGNNLLFIHSPIEGCLCNYEYKSPYEQSFTIWWRSILNTFSYTYWLFVFLHYEVSVQIITHFVTVAFLLLFYRSFLCILDTECMYLCQICMLWKCSPNLFFPY